MTSLFKYVESVLEKADQTAARTLQTINAPKSSVKKHSEKQKFNAEEYVKSKTEQLEKQLQQLQEEHDAKKKQTSAQPAISSTTSSEENGTPQRTESQKSSDEIKEQKSSNEKIEQKSNDDVLEKLRIANEFLKTNITSLHQEVGELSKKNEELSKKNKDLKKELQEKETYVDELKKRLESQLQRLLKEKMETEGDFATTMQKKEQQHKELEKQLDDAIQQLKAKDTIISKMRKEKEKLENERNALEIKVTEETQRLMEIVNKLQQSLETQAKSYEEKLAEKEQLEITLSQEKENIKAQYHEVQESLQQKVDEIIRLKNQLSAKEQEWSDKNKELEEYKNRAIKVLQTKDKLIEELKAGKVTTVKVDEDLELEKLKLKEEMNQKIEQLKSEKEELLVQAELLKRQREAEQTSNRLKLRNLTSELEQQKAAVAKLNQTLVSLRINNDELKQKLEESQRFFKEHKKEKKEEPVKQVQTPNQIELEARLKTMAEHLIEKQTHIETLKSEKAALALQLEKETQRCKELELLNRLTPPPVANSRERFESVIDIETHVPMKTTTFFTDLSKRGFFARSFGRGMHFLDMVSIRFGRYLRRAPWLRVIFVLYILLLHIWVLFVLLQSAPQVDNLPTTDDK